MKLFARTALHAAVEAEPDLDLGSCIDIIAALRKRAADFGWEETCVMQGWPEPVLVRLAQRPDFPCHQAVVDALTNIEHAERRDARKLEQRCMGFGGKGANRSR